MASGNEPKRRSFGESWLAPVLLLTAILAALFHRSFHPDFVLRANDGPLGALESQAEQPVGEIPLDQLTAAVRQFDNAFSTACIDDQRTILRGFIDHIDVDRDENLLTGVIYYYYPPTEPNDSPNPDAVSISPSSPGVPLF